MAKLKLVSLRVHGFRDFLVEANNDEDAAKIVLNGKAIEVRAPNRMTLNIGVKTIPEDMTEEFRNRMDAAKESGKRILPPKSKTIKGGQ